MELKRYLFMAGIAALSLCGCNDMENIPTNKFTDNSYWTSEAKAQYVVNMAYSQMYNAGRMWSDESLSDNAYDGRGVDDQRTIRKGMATPSLNLFNNEWNDLYGGLKTCHVFLDKVNLVPNMNAQNRARMEAEVRFIRASIYFRLTNLYGAVPFYTSDITLEESQQIGRTPRTTIVDFIHSELDEIADELPSRDELPSTERGKITKGAVAALQARVYLMDGDWDNVMKYCSYLMDNKQEYGSYDLFPTYAGVFEEANEYNEEVILDRSYVPSVLSWSEMGDMAPLSVGARTVNRVPQQSLVDSYLMLSGKTISEAGTDYNASRPYENRDPRLTATVVYDGYRWSENVNDGSTGVIIQVAPGSGTEDAYTGGENGTSTGYFVRKYYSPQATGDLSSGVNLIMMRYADILLMYAEAYHEKNGMNQEVWDKTIRRLRARAGFTAATALDFPTQKDTEAMRQIIRNERRCELAMEGLRWFDIKRWKAGTEYLSGKVRGAAFVDANRLDTRSFDEGRDYLWAVPFQQINLNPNLAPNNPGYGN